LSIAAASALGGCGHNKSANTATQVVAKVNGHEVTVSQLNQVLAAMNVPKSDPNAMKQAMTRLITEELAVQAAQRDKLDKDPAVAMRIEAAKRAVLARAYEERQVFTKAAIPEAELHRYYDQNPALFGARRLYQFSGFETTLTKLPPGMTKELDVAHTADAVRAILNQYNIEYQTGEVTRGAETLPGELPKRLESAAVGDIVIAPNATGHAELLLLTRVETAPVSFEQARAAITRFLTVQHNQAALDAAVKTLESQAKIEYLNGG